MFTQAPVVRPEIIFDPRDSVVDVFWCVCLRLANGGKRGDGTEIGARKGRREGWRHGNDDDSGDADHDDHGGGKAEET